MLKKSLVLIVALFGLQSFAAENPFFNVRQFNQKIFAEVSPSGIPWAVGDTADYSLDLGGFLKGTMKMFVREITSEGLWLEQDIDIQIQQQKVETLLDVETGRVKKVLVNGEEQKMGDPADTEIVDSKPDNVTVPAGTFECSYLKIHDKKQNSDSELWVNPELVPMVGLIKQAATSQIGPVTIELTGFQKK